MTHSHSECGPDHKWCGAQAARLPAGREGKGKDMDERMVTFALFLVVVVAVPVLVAVGVDIARRIAAHLHAQPVATHDASGKPELP